MKIATCSHCNTSTWVNNSDTVCECAKCHMVFGVTITPPKQKVVSERDEIAKEIFKLLTIDLTKAAMESQETAKRFHVIMESNCKTAFMHANLFMEQKAKCPSKYESN